MSMEHTLAKLTPGSPSLTPGIGGLPELTSSDIAAALGFAGRVPDACIGIHLVMAKYSDDAIAIDRLRRIVARMAWTLWFDLGIEARITRQQIDRLAQLALIDFINPGAMRDATPTHLARQIPVDPRTWAAGMGKLYHEVIGRMRDIEAPVFRMLYKVLAR